MTTLHDFFEDVAQLPDFSGISPVNSHTRSHFGDTPLHVAAIRGDVQMIRLLLGAGADIDARGEHGYTPLHEAVEQNQPEAVALLISRGGSRTAANDDGETPLTLARLLNRREVEILLHTNVV